MIPSPTDPEALLAGLDPEQRVAAEALRGPVCVLAGAGTGKTRAITHRIAYGVASGTYAANRVLALTFTTRAAAELRSRLRQLGAGAVSARTFHSAALSQLNYFWPHTVGGQFPTLITGKAKMLGQLAESRTLRLDTATLRDLAAEIEWRKVSGLSIEQYAASDRAGIGNLSLTQVAELQQGYEDLKDGRRQLDFEDVLLACVGMIHSEASVALQVREQYRFFVVDEYQDVSPLQQQLLDAWLGDRNDVCVVGDASQTIYSFAGAQSSYLLEFPQRHRGTTLVQLERNYRSTEPIVDSANRLMRGRPGALVLRAATPEAAEPPAAARKPAWPEPEVSRFRDDMAEARGVAQQILERERAGTAFADMAVLFRVNVQSGAFEQALTEAGIPFRLHGGARFFDRPEVRQALMELRGASVSIVGEPLFKSVSDVLRSQGWTVDPPESAGALRDRWEALNAIMNLVDQAAPDTTLRRFTDDLLERQAGQHEPTMPAVTLATVHSAKGLEWEAVFLAGLSEGLIPISYATTFEAIDEERRLMYVGITRARSFLGLSWSERGPRANGLREPSRFLTEIGSRRRPTS
ncbi:ATP-dependent helicase [Mycetocola spongiae]|uniref:ATP-dependent helicase n=1 Tax=Mycetocola spongiae TaxID=2859226 RepID=UPI001CF50AA8|nr:ATP-dependent helicase [Mycetocola spongiae]UCR89075.1 ATP-dependent helicase [Mycetocola spongiae]